MKRRMENTRRRIKIKEVNSILAHAAALMLTGVPPVVCETVLDEFYSSVRKSFERMKV
ncbi:hypothetical protein [Flavisolibacter ginsenosidimutans]|uniref:hypothetical protein n=1 Tax=Flavisolibacter ginsenosidimutans TaxID=661481 RepID=UPI00155AC387|nr:hypothetical protein [Flavisolibacter ginsenosidimutans]